MTLGRRGAVVPPLLQALPGAPLVVPFAPQRALLVISYLSGLTEAD